ncbi:MAG: tetratricopeptide repeat protein [Chitinivibrionales bacterium]
MSTDNRSEILKHIRSCIQERDYNEAETAFDNNISPEDYKSDDLMYLGGIIKQNLNKYREALECFRKCYRLSPENIQFSYNYATLLLKFASYKESERIFESILSKKPGHKAASANYSSLLLKKGEISKAERILNKILDLYPDNPDILTVAGNLYRESGKPEKAFKTYKRAESYTSESIVTLSNKILSTNYFFTSRQDSLSIHTEFQKVFSKFHSDKELKPRPLKNRRLKIAYLSKDFKTHSVAYFAEPLLRMHSREEFQIYGLSDVMRPDHVTKRLSNLDLIWKDTTQMTNQALLEYIRGEGIDILIDLGGHTNGVRLPVFMMRAASVQITYLGYPNTTGIKNMDWRICDNLSDPEENSPFYTEELYRLPDTFLSYLPPATTPGTKESPVKHKGYLTFGSFNNISKYSNKTIELWSSIIKEIPGSKLLLKAKQFRDEGIKKEFTRRFSEYGVDTQDILFRPHTSSVQDHLKTYDEIDIALDPYPYNGTTTTLEALWMGVPVITRYSSVHASRVGLSILSAAGLSSLSSDSDKKYIETAIYFGAHPERLNPLHKNLRNSLLNSPLCRYKDFVLNFEHALKEMIKTRI